MWDEPVQEVHIIFPTVGVRERGGEGGPEGRVREVCGEEGGGEKGFCRGG